MPLALRGKIMSTTHPLRVRLSTHRRLIIATTILGVAAPALLLATTGRTLGQVADYGIRYVKAFVMSNRDSDTVRGYSRGQFTNVVFLHRSVGHNLIEQGNVRPLFAAAGYSFWDQG